MDGLQVIDFVLENSTHPDEMPRFIALGFLIFKWLIETNSGAKQSIQGIYCLAIEDTTSGSQNKNKRKKKKHR